MIHAVALATALVVVASPEVDRVAGGIVRVSSTARWTPRRFRGEAGRVRARLYATMLIEEAATVGLGDVLDLLVAQVHKESGWNPRAAGRVGEVGFLQVFGSDWRSRAGRPARWACPETTAELLLQPRLALRCGLRELAHWRATCPEPTWYAAHKCGACEADVGPTCPGRTRYVRGSRKRLRRIAPP